MILAIDTSTQAIAAALYDEGGVVAEMLWNTSNRHTVELTTAVDSLMRRCGIATQDLTLLVAALGPGTFTGLRIGLAFIKGLALSRHLPVIGVPTFDYMAAAQPLADTPMVVILPAGRKRLAAGWYAVKEGAWQPVSKPEVLTPEELSERIEGPTILCGELNVAERQVLGRKWKNAKISSPAQSTRRPAMLAELGLKRWQAGQRDDPVLLSPIYLHVAGGIPD